MKTVLKTSLFLITILLFNGCKRDTDLIPEKADNGVTLNLKINYKVDGAALIFDSILYTNTAGNNYEVSRLEYYISNITFHSTSGKDFSPKDIFYVNAQMPLTNNISLDSIPKGSYNYITFNIGIDTAHNISFSLPNTNENINMAWPNPLGGGFLCPCHGSTFDMAGRVFKNKPAPDNLEVPPHMYMSDTKILIGDDKKA